jgi:hypothetical protein
MAERDNFNHEDFTEDQFTEKKSTRPGPPQDEEPSEFERRLRGVKRETTKRQRSAQKQARLDLIEEEYGSRGRGTDRRARVKEAKRKYAELKRIADKLEIKQMLQNLGQSAKFHCWGPDVASEKTRLSIGVFLNYTDKPIDQAVPKDAPAQWTPKLFGVWLYLSSASEDQIYVVVGAKTPEEDAGQAERSLPPRRDERLMTIPYAAAEHDRVQEQIRSALMNWMP